MAFLKKDPLFSRFYLSLALSTEIFGQKPKRKIARNVPRIRHLLERPRRTFLPHEGLRKPLFSGFCRDCINRNTILFLFYKKSIPYRIFSKKYTRVTNAPRRFIKLPITRGSHFPNVIRHVSKAWSAGATAKSRGY